MKYMSEVQNGTQEATEILTDAFGILNRRMIEAHQEDYLQLNDHPVVEELLDAGEPPQSPSQGLHRYTDLQTPGAEGASDP
jgi:hypothetical protein